MKEYTVTLEQVKTAIHNIRYNCYHPFDFYMVQQAYCQPKLKPLIDNLKSYSFMRNLKHIRKILQKGRWNG
jgi:hypothetical protein